MDVTQQNAFDLKQFIYNCIAYHVIDEWHEKYNFLAEDIIKNYVIHSLDGGVIAWKWIDDDSVYVWETKSHTEKKGAWARKVINAIKEIKSKSGAKYIKMDTTSEKVRDFMVKRLGFEYIGEESQVFKYYVLKQGE